MFALVLVNWVFIDWMEQSQYDRLIRKVRQGTLRKRWLRPEELYKTVFMLLIPTMNAPRLACKGSRKPSLASQLRIKRVLVSSFPLSSTFLINCYQSISGINLILHKLWIWVVAFFSKNHFFCPIEWTV